MSNPTTSGAAPRPQRGEVLAGALELALVFLAPWYVLLGAWRLVAWAW